MKMEYEWERKKGSCEWAVGSQTTCHPDQNKMTTIQKVQKIWVQDKDPEGPEDPVAI